MVAALEEIRHVEDINTLCGFSCLLLEKSEDAKEFFAKSFNTKEALDICRDLLQWEQAMLLAAKHDPDKVPYIAREYAYQLEFT